jgi:hypothetical protein
MQLTARAIEALKDSYTDKVIETYNQAVANNFSDFPAECIRVLKSIHEELAWSEEGSLITSEQAGNLWEAVQETAQSLLDAWEPEVDK